MTPQQLLSRAAGLALGVLVDRAIADPRRFHPVAGFGAIAARLEAVLYPRSAAPRPARAAGGVYALALVGGAASLGVVIDKAIDLSIDQARGGGIGGAGGSSSSPSRPVHVAAICASSAGTAICVWACLGGTSLLRVAGELASTLAAGDDAVARELLPWLCGRDPEQLDGAEMARAVVESLAENTSDAHVAPVFWAAVAGTPGVLAYRAANTLDAMVGHRNERYEHFGWAAARLDDLLNLVPARLAGLATVALAPLLGGAPRDALASWRDDAGAHPSPNAGVVEASAAGALGVRLGGRTPYPYRTEWRAELNPLGRPVRVADIARAVRLERRVQDGVSVVSVVALLALASRARAARRGVVA